MGWGWAAAGLAAAAAAAYVAAKLMEVLWWRPRRVEEHFARQGIRGPRYRFFVGCVREMVALMVAASAAPMPRPYRSHNVLPRVLAFYHHWRKIYGTRLRASIPSAACVRPCRLPPSSVSPRQTESGLCFPKLAPSIVFFSVTVATCYGKARRKHGIKSRG
jgi:hypothetical protein